MPINQIPGDLKQPTLRVVLKNNTRDLHWNNELNDLKPTSVLFKPSPQVSTDYMFKINK